MKLVSAQEARTIGRTIYCGIVSGNIEQANAPLAAVLDDKNAFRLLDQIGKEISAASSDDLFPFLDMTAKQRTMGGWVVIAAALHAHSGAGLGEILEKCRAFIIYADTWYACDCFGERVPGPFLVSDLDVTIAALSPWRFDNDAWIRRAVGVAIHFWAKRSRGAEDQRDSASKLFTFIKPMLGEKEFQAAKGIGWGLKSLGRYYPDLAFEFLNTVLITEPKQISGLIKRKALTYLPAEMKQGLTGQIR